MRKVLYILFTLISTLLLYSCAVEQAPLGGPKDTIAPLPDSLKSTPNEQLFFEKQTIELVFNEWVKLKNPGQIIVSPPLEHGIKAKLKKKSLLLEFDEAETLFENTTYTINLGQAIVDYTVGNAMQNYTYVFSTGAYLDSLSIFGNVKDDLTGEPIEGALVSLYANLSDTAFFKIRPMYFAITDKEGKYRINNVRSDTFRVFALGDKNVNYFKDQESETMGFLKDYVILDSLYTGPTNLGHFLAEPELRISNKDHSYGQLKLTLNKKVDSLSYQFDPPLESYQELFLQDSLFIWYRNREERQLIVQTRADKIDTIPLLIDNDSIKYNRALSLQGMNVSSRKRLSPQDSLILTFNTPIISINPSGLIVSDTSGKTIKLEIEQDKKDLRKVKVISKWKEDIKYDIIINPNAFTNHFEATNDTIKKLFFTNKMESLGEIIFEMDSLDKESNYIVELTKSKETIRRYVESKKSAKFSIKSLDKGKYTIRIIEDRNKNNRWDSGNFTENNYSEKWISKELDELKAGWTLEVTINGDEFK